MLLEGQGPVDHQPQEFGAGIELEGVTPHRNVRLPSGVPGARGEEGDHALLTEEHLLLLAPFFDLLDSQLDVSASFFFVVVAGPDGEVVSEETIVDKVFDLIRQGVDVKNDEQQGGGHSSLRNSVDQPSGAAKAAVEHHLELPVAEEGVEPSHQLERDD